LFKSEDLCLRRNLIEGLVVLKQVEMDKINQHDFAGLYPSLTGVVNIQGDFEITDHKTPHERHKQLHQADMNILVPQ